MGRVKHCSSQYLKLSKKKKKERLSLPEAATDQEEKKSEVEFATLLSKLSKIMQTL
jgi:biotin-(acetyl-CoA carboxylase) ligase